MSENIKINCVEVRLVRTNERSNEREKREAKGEKLPLGKQRRTEVNGKEQNMLSANVSSSS